MSTIYINILFISYKYKIISINVQYCFQSKKKLKTLLFITIYDLFEICLKNI